MAASPSGALPKAAPSPLEALPMAASPSGALPQAAPSPRAVVLSAGAFPTCPRPGRRGASREKASITLRIAEVAQRRDNITSGANNDNSTSDNPPPPIVPPPGEECFRLKNYHVRFVVEMFVNRMMFVDMFVNGSARSGCCEPRSERFWRASVCGDSYHLSLGGDSSAQLGCQNNKGSRACKGCNNRQLLVSGCETKK